MEKEGVIKYQDKSIETKLNFPDIKELNSWRQIFYIKNLIGKDKSRYEGNGYGNISQRLQDIPKPENKRSFIITGSQTGGLENLTKKHYALVLEYYPERNLIISQKGPINASSEAMTHGTIYDADEKIKFVFHVHSPEIWNNAEKLGIPITKREVSYGTPEMADEVNRLFRDTNVKNINILSMGGHEDGIFSFGETADKAGTLILNYLARAREF